CLPQHKDCLLRDVHEFYALYFASRPQVDAGPVAISGIFLVRELCRVTVEYGRERMGNHVAQIRSIMGPLSGVPTRQKFALDGATVRCNQAPSGDWCSLDLACAISQCRYECQRVCFSGNSCERFGLARVD